MDDAEFADYFCFCEICEICVENRIQWIFSVDWICCIISYSPDFANE